MKAPFVWFGGKSRIAAEVWQRLGADVPSYVEPFAGSLAVLLARPDEPGVETVNDKDGFLANFWRALRHDPEGVAVFADWPVNENDLHARHAWLVERRNSIQARLEGNPDYHDVQVAGWWVWGLNLWIGSGWCSGAGPWQVVDGELVDTRKRPHLGNAGQGVHRKLPHLGNAGQGVHRKLPHLGNAGRGVHRQRQALTGYFSELAERLRGVRVCCGDWARVVTPAVCFPGTDTVAVFLDPPYGHAERETGLYMEDNDIAADVRRWAIERGEDRRYRIALCGYEGEHEMPESWEVLSWKTAGGYAGQAEGSRAGENAFRERIWFSPGCLKIDRARQAGLFDGLSQEALPWGT